MENKKGFTLIELLAVIVVLAIIALITTPIVLNTITDARKGAFRAAVYGIIEATEQDHYLNILSGHESEEIIYTYNNRIETSSIEGRSLNYKGQKPLNGSINVNIEGDIKLALTDGVWCAQKEYNVSEVTLVKESDNCEIPVLILNPTIILTGGTEIDVEINTEFTDPGYEGVGIYGTDMTSEIVIVIKKGLQVVDEIRTNELTSYTITYNIEEEDKYSEVIRIVNIVDTTPPELIVPEDITLTVDELPSFDVMTGVSATDNSGESPAITVSGNISAFPGEYTLTYKAIDSSGNEVIINRIVNVVEEPVLMIGSSGEATTPYLEGPINKEQIESIVFETTNIVPSGVTGSWDVSDKKNDSIMAWYKDNDSNGLYEVTIGGVEKVSANPNSSHLFRYLTNLKTINFNNFDTSKVTNMTYMFDSASSLTSLNLSTFDTSKVTNMSYMFRHTSSLTSLDLSSFNTSNVINMMYMFGYASSLTNLNLSNFNTSKVTNMSHMFRNVISLTNLNLSNFDTSKVTNISQMFYYAISLASLDFRNATFTEVNDYGSMFGAITSGINIYTKNSTTKSWLESRLSEASKTGTVTITP